MPNIRIEFAACVLLAGCIVTAHAAPSQVVPSKTHTQNAASDTHTPQAASQTHGAANKTHTRAAASTPHKPAAIVSHFMLALGPKVTAPALANVRGGSNVENRVKLDGNVSDTRTRNVVTGMNSVGGGAFANAAGLSVVIQNSGNGVLIQNSTVVNVQLKQ